MYQRYTVGKKYLFILSSGLTASPPEYIPMELVCVDEKLNRDDYRKVSEYGYLFKNEDGDYHDSAYHCYNHDNYTAGMKPLSSEKASVGIQPDWFDAMDSFAQDFYLDFVQHKLIRASDLIQMLNKPEYFRLSLFLGQHIGKYLSSKGYSGKSFGDKARLLMDTAEITDVT